MGQQKTITPRTGRLLAGLPIVALWVGFVGPSHSADEPQSPPEYTFDGLKLIPNTKVSALYMREGVDFSGYDKVAILDCDVAFRKDWRRDHNSSSQSKVSDSDMTRIKTYLADELKRVFTERLTAKGETVTIAPGTGVLILRPAIINLDVSVPADPDSREIYSSDSAGQATLYLELVDSVTGELLARAIDVEVAGARGYISVRNGATNRTDTNLLLMKWADLLATFLQSARASATVPAE